MILIKEKEKNKEVIPKSETKERLIVKEKEKPIQNIKNNHVKYSWLWSL